MKRSFFFGAITNGSDMLMFVLMAVAGRVLGAHDFGAFSYVQALAAVGLTLMSFGLDPLVVRELSKDHGKGPEYLFIMLWWKLPVGVVSLVGLQLVGKYVLGLSPADLWALWLIGFATMLRLVGLGLRVMLRPLGHYDREAGSAAIEQTLLLVIGSIVLVKGYGLVGLAWAFCLARTAGLIVALAFVTRHIPLRWMPNFELAVATQKMAAPVGLSLILTTAYLQIDTLLLKELKGYEQVGLYNVALKVFTAMMILPSIVSGVLLPYLSRTFVTSRLAHNRMVLLGIGVSLGAALPVSFLGIVLAQPMIELVFGAEYLPAANAMRILFAALVLTMQVSFMQTLLIAVNRQSMLLRISLAALISRFFLGWVLIPRWNLEGAAVAMVASQVLVLAGGWTYLFRKHFQVRNVSELVRKAAQAAASA